MILGRSEITIKVLLTHHGEHTRFYHANIVLSLEYWVYMTIQMGHLVNSGHSRTHTGFYCKYNITRQFHELANEGQVLRTFRDNRRTVIPASRHKLAGDIRHDRGDSVAMRGDFIVFIFQTEPIKEFF